MGRRTVEQSASDPGVVIVTRSGGCVNLPRKEISGSGKDKITITDFSSVNPCPRCGTEPHHDGSLPSSAGFLRVYAIHNGIWAAYVGACDCVFGAWRTVERRTEEGVIPKMRYADELPGIPPGLSNDEWTLLNLYKLQGDDYRSAAARIPESNPSAREIRGIIARWCGGQMDRPAPMARDEPVPILFGGTEVEHISGPL